MDTGDRQWHNEFSNPFITHRAEKALWEWLLCLTTLIVWFDMVYLPLSLENIILMLKKEILILIYFLLLLSISQLSNVSVMNLLLKYLWPFSSCHKAI